MKELWCIACAEDHHVQCLGRGCQCAHLVEVAVPSLSVSGEPTSKARLHVCQTQGGWWSVRIHGPELWEQLDDGSPRWAEIEIGRGDTEAGARQDAQQWLASFPSGVSVEPIRALIAEWLADAAKCDAVIRKVNRRGDGDAFALVELRQEQSTLRGCAKQLESLLPLPVPPAIPTEEERTPTSRKTDTRQSSASEAPSRGISASTAGKAASVHDVVCGKCGIPIRDGFCGIGCDGRADGIAVVFLPLEDPA